MAARVSGIARATERALLAQVTRADGLGRLMQHAQSRRGKACLFEKVGEVATKGSFDAVEGIGSGSKRIHLRRGRALGTHHAFIEHGFGQRLFAVEVVVERAACMSALSAMSRSELAALEAGKGARPQFEARLEANVAEKNYRLFVERVLPVLKSHDVGGDIGVLHDAVPLKQAGTR